MCAGMLQSNDGSVHAVDVFLEPVSYHFAASHRIRLAIAGADKGNFSPVKYAATRWKVHRGQEFSSFVTLPVEVRGSEPPMSMQQLRAL